MPPTAERPDEIPCADWSQVSCDGVTLRGVSARSGPFELSAADILAIGGHVRYRDDTSWVVPEEDCWLTFLTSFEYGFIYETKLTDSLAAELRAFIGDDELSPYPYWGRWNHERGCDSRFIYPPWVDGFSIYEWPNETNNKPTLFSRVIGYYGYAGANGVLGETLRWLYSKDRAEQQRNWESVSARPPAPSGLGPQRSRHHYVPGHYWLLPWVVSCLALVAVLARWADGFRSTTGSLTMALLIALLAAPWWSVMFSQTRLHDHGIRLRRWFLLSTTLFYQDIREIEDDGNGTRLTTDDGLTVRIPQGHHVPAVVVRDLQRRSLAIRCGPAMGIPFRLPETGG